MQKKAGLLDWITGIGGKYYGLAFGGAALSGLAGGYGLAKLTEPTVITDKEVTDRELVKEALESEIDATERRIAELKRKRQQLAAARNERPYDRFV